MSHISKLAAHNIMRRLEAPAQPAAAVPAQVVEIDYTKLIADCYTRTKAEQGTRGCVQFKAGAEWFREQVLAALTPQPAAAPESAERQGGPNAE